MITYSFVIRFECMTRHFDRVDLMIRLKLFWSQSDVPRKMGSKPSKCTNFLTETPGVQIEYKSCPYDRVDLTTRVNAFLCQSNTQN